MSEQSTDKKTDKKVFKKILKNYNHLNAAMVEELDLASTHDGLTGQYREEMWMKFFRNMIPKKYSLAQGVILIDSDKGVSNEVDIAVYDEQYTPYVYQYNTLKFIPIEAVAVVIECKSTSYEPSKLEAWAKAVDDLEPKRTGVARIMTGYACGLTNKSQVRTRPIKILVSLKNSENEETLNAHAKELGAFDFILEQHKKEFKLVTKKEDKKLSWWAQRLNNGADDEHNEKPEESNPAGEEIGLKLEHFKESYKSEAENFTIKDGHLQNTLEDLRIKGSDLLTLNLQLNQLLMLLNNPMLFPHFAYAKAFSDISLDKTSACTPDANTPDPGGE